MLGALAFAVTTTVTSTVALPAGHAAAASEQVVAAPGPLGPVSVIGDSVLLGSVLYGPTLADQLAARGWGPIRMRAGGGYSTGRFAVSSEFKVSDWIARWRQQGWDPTDVVVNLGANDSGFCRGDVACARDAITFLLDAIGPGHRVWWPKITRFYTRLDEQDAWNQALDEIAAERDDVWTWDWPTEMAVGGYQTSDLTHLAPDSYRKRSAVMAREITADLAYARHAGPDAPLPSAIGDPSTFVALPPQRVLDTRDGGGPALAGGATATVDLSPLVPPGTVAVAVNLTSDASSEPGFLTGYPCDRPPGEVSSVNHDAGVARGAMGVIPLSADGRLCVLTRSPGHVIVDLQGAFVAGDGGARFTPSAPSRLLDTRVTGRSPIVEIPVPGGADVDAVAVNVTATGVTDHGWVKAYPCGDEPPEVSNVNYRPGDTVASTAFVPVSPSGSICVQSLTSVDVTVDITGTFAAGGALRFVPAEPRRVLDTRSGLGGWSPLQGSDQTIDVQVAPPAAEAVTGTITLVAPLRPGYLTAHPCGAAAGTSSVNALAGDVLANAATVGTPGGRLCIRALAATHTLFDVTGWWVP